jgi:hypothetical protein
MYIPAGKGGCFDIQGELPAGSLAELFNSSTIKFNPDEIDPGLGIEQLPNVPEFAYNFTYPQERRFKVLIFSI